MSVRKLNLGYRIVIYTVAMFLLVGVFLLVLHFGGWLSDDLLSKEEPTFLTWMVCFGAGLASLIIVEPFRRPDRSPYGFLIGGAVRTVPPLALVILFLTAKQPVSQLFWINLLIAYFTMLSIVIPLTLPTQPKNKDTRFE